MDNIVHKGPMYCLVVGILQKMQWTERFYVLYGSSNSNRSRLDYFENEDVFLHEPKYRRSVFIEDMKEINRRSSIIKGRGHVIEVELDHNGKSLLLSCDSQEEQERWMRHLQDERHNSAAPPLPPAPAILRETLERRPNGSQSPGGPLERRPSGGRSSRNPLERRSSGGQLLREPLERRTSGGSYVSLAPAVCAVYPVEIAMTESARQCGLSGTYYLAITTRHLELRNGDGTALYTWPYKLIRRYGKSTSSFTFEAGRKCESGSGLFTFLTSDGDTMFKTVQQQTQSIRQSTGSIGGQEPPALPERNSVLSNSGLQLDEDQHRLGDNKQAQPESATKTPPMLKPIQPRPPGGDEYAQVQKGPRRQSLVKKNSGDSIKEEPIAEYSGDVYYSPVNETPSVNEPDYAIYDITQSSRFTGRAQAVQGYEEPVYELPEPVHLSDASLGDICAELRKQSVQDQYTTDTYDTLMLASATNTRAACASTYACLGKKPLARTSSSHSKSKEDHLYDEVSINN